MTESGATEGRTWQYRFSLPGSDVELEVRQLGGDDLAASYARELSKAQKSPVVIQRKDHVDYEYVTEVDERR